MQNPWVIFDLFVHGLSFDHTSLSCVKHNLNMELTELNSSKRGKVGGWKGSGGHKAFTLTTGDKEVFIIHSDGILSKSVSGVVSGSVQGRYINNCDTTMTTRKM